MDIRPVRTEADYESALAEIEGMMGAAEGSEEADRLEVLAILVEAYERRHYPVAAPSPVEAIKFRLEQAGLSRKDLEPMIGSRARVSEVLCGKRRLTLAMIRRLSKGLGIPAALLVGEEPPGPENRVCH